MKTSIILIFVFFLNSVINAQYENNRKAVNDRYALVIGISSYENSANNLKYARKDAEDFRNSLLEYGKFNKENVKLLVDKQASRENIRKNIEGWLKTIAKKNDLVIIFFSGHGIRIPDTDGDEDDALDECLVPYDYATDDNSSLIVDDLFAYWIGNLQSNNILIIFDNCFSGGAAKQKGILLPGMKGGEVEAGDDFSKDISREVPRDGTALLAASKPNQVSFEEDEFRNGVFTHFLIAAISSFTDNNFNNIIEAQELFYYTRNQTLEYSRNKFKREQEPIFINTIKNEIRLFYLPAKEIEHESSKKLKLLLYRAEQEKNAEKKIDTLREALKIDPSNFNIHSSLAFEYRIAGRLTEALYHYEYLYSEDKSFFLPLYTEWIGDIYTGMKDFESALQWYSEALEMQPDNFGLYNSIARLKLINDDTLAAIQNLNKSIQIQPLQLIGYKTLFYIHYYQNSLSTAFKIISDCHEINPNDYETIYWYGSFQKYFDNNTLRGDSLLTYFENNSGIEINKSEIWKDKSRLVYDVNGDYLKGGDIQQFVLEKAIARYPYYDSFYKQYIQFLVDKKVMNPDTTISDKYLMYSKLNPDSSFIKKYIK